MKAKIQSGFTLVEVLVSLALFAVGMLGVGFHLGQNIKTSVNTYVYPTALQIANQTIETLNDDLRRNNTRFQTTLGALTQPTTPRFINGNPLITQFTIQLNPRLAATDGNNNALLTTPPANWVAPYTVNFIVTYTRTAIPTNNNSQSNNNIGTISFPVSYVFS